MRRLHVNDSVHWYMNELTSRVVADTGIPSNRFHLGKIILQSLKDDPDFTLQIDGATDQSETGGSVLQRSVRCASSFRNFGLQHGDIMILMAPNHLDLAIPFYAALYLGIVIAAVDRTLGLKELRSTFILYRPRIIFCQSEKVPDIQIALKEADVNAEIITFDNRDYILSYKEFMEKYADDTTVDDFKATDFDPQDTLAFLITTSGTTSLPKAAAVTHKSIAISLPYLWSRNRNFPCPTRLALLASPLQMLTAAMTYVRSAILRHPCLITSGEMSQEHTYHLINTYKPSFASFSPTWMTTLLKPGDRDQCDFTCFELIMLAGSAYPKELTEELKNVAPDVEVMNGYGMTEITTIAFLTDNPPPGSSGKPLGSLQYRIINVETTEDINEPNVPGELWVKGPGIFKVGYHLLSFVECWTQEYYNNEEATQEAFAEDRWFKTGDIFYRDENWNYFFIDRIKLMLKYKRNKISPIEIEDVIRKHAGVLDVVVTGIPDPECGDLPVACIVPRPDQKPTAQEIKDIVKESLADPKQLRGGVIFLKALPLNASSKVHRKKINEMVLTMDRE